MRMIKEHTQAQRKTNKTIMLSHKDKKSFAVTRFNGMTVLALFLIMTLTAPLQDIYAVQDNDRSLSALAQQIVIDRSDEVMTISLDINEMKLYKALEILTSEMGVGLSYSSDTPLDKIVSLQLNEVPFHEALYALLEGTNLEPLLPPTKDVLVIREKEEDVETEIYQETVSGTVVDAETGELLPGVNVVVQGTSTGTATDLDGRFELNVNSLNETLIFSYIGYVMQEVSIDGRQTIDIQLEPDAIAGDELVVIGYGLTRKSDMTGSVGSISEEVIQQRSPTNMQEALAGRISGVHVSMNSGRPGGRATVRVRGNTSITGSNEPLYVVDGIILPVANLSNATSPIDYLDPGNIESIEVLKDASATAIYGSRGSNGVILITTKSPGQDITNITYNTSLSAGKLRNPVDVLNAEEFLNLEVIAYQNAEKFGLEDIAVDPMTKRTDPRLFDSSGNPLYDTDWHKEAYRTAITHNHNLSISGRSGNTNYIVDLAFRDEEGILLNSSLRRYSGRLAVDNQVTDWLIAGGSLTYNNQDESQPRVVGAGGITPTRSVMQAIPIIPVRYPDGSWGRTRDYPGMEGGAQPVLYVNEVSNILETENILGNAYLNLELSDRLEFRSSFSINNLGQTNKSSAAPDLLWITDVGRASISNSQFNSWQFENYLTYQSDFSEVHSIVGLLGASWERSESFRFSASTQDFLDSYFKYNNLSVGANPGVPSSIANEHSLNSFFARINYTIDNKYLFTITGRTDGSSRFAVEHQYGFFPSVAVGWRISEENFMQNFSVISELKLRASYGLTGNSEIPNYRTVTGLGNYTYFKNGQRVTGIGVSRMANTDLRWEETSQYDIGLELGLFEDRISFEGDIYYKKTEDMLLNAPVPMTSGYNSVIRNVGDMENYGIELSLRSVNISSLDFLWSTEFNLSMNRNKVLRLTGGQDIHQGFRIIREGEAVNSFYGFIQQGTWNTDQADEAAIYDRLPGDIRFKDVNNDGAITDADRVIIGNGEPDGYGSLINNFTYKNFELMVDLQFMYGNDVLLSTYRNTLYRTGITNVLSIAKDAWTPDNQDTDMPQIRPIQGYRDRTASTGNLFDASFIRGRNIELAYNFSPTVIQNWGGLNNLRVYARMQNFFVLTNYHFYDPEVSSSPGNFSQGEDNFSYPKPRVFQLGVSVSL